MTKPPTLPDNASGNPAARARPRRAEPLQPDRPTLGDDSQEADVRIADIADPALRAQRAKEELERSAVQLHEQSKAALDNVTKGYD